MENATLPANGEAMSTDPLAPRGPMSCEIDMAALRTLSMQELYDLRSAIHTVNDVVAGLASQPRFSCHNQRESNQAGRLLEAIAEWLLGYEQAVVNVGADAKPSEPAEVEMRGWLIVSFEADMADALDTLAVTVTEAVRDKAKAEFYQQHSRRVGQ